MTMPNYKGFIDTFDMMNNTIHHMPINSKSKIQYALKMAKINQSNIKIKIKTANDLIVKQMKALPKNALLMGIEKQLDSDMGLL